jgi:hypothetical protein
MVNREKLALQNLVTASANARVLPAGKAATHSSPQDNIFWLGCGLNRVIVWFDLTLLCVVSWHRLFPDGIPANAVACVPFLCYTRSVEEGGLT